MEAIKQDGNKIIDIIGTEWAKDVTLLRKRVAILLEENERLMKENEQLKPNIEKEDDEE